MVNDSVYVLHTRKLSDSKIIIEFFSKRYGRLAGVSYVKNNKKSGYITPQGFIEYSVFWSGTSSLKKIHSIEQSGPSYSFVNVQLYCMLYVNELLYRLLAEGDAHEEIFSQYARLLGIFSCEISRQDIETNLRYFELSTLRELGYSIDFEFDSQGNDIISSESEYYMFRVDEGFVNVPADTPVLKRNMILRGVDVVALQNIKNASSESRKQLKFLCRTVINGLLNGKPLKTRELFF